MATLYVEYYERAQGGILGDLLANDTIAVGAGSLVVSTACPGSAPSRYVVRLITDTACQYDIATAPVASATSRFMPAGSDFTLDIAAGDKVAVIQQQ